MDNHIESYKPSQSTKSNDSNLLNDGATRIVRSRTVSFVKNENGGEMVTIDLVNQPEAEERTGQTVMNDSDIYLAATYIIDAVETRNYQFNTDPGSLRNYHLYNNRFMQYVLYFFVFVILMLAIFEEPAVNGLSMPYWSTHVLELACLAYFVFRMRHHRSFTPRRIWWTDAKNIILVVAISVMCVDMILMTVLVETGVIEKPFRWSRMLRPLFLVNFPEMREIRRSFRNIRHSLNEILTVLILLFLILFLFALLGRELFSDDDLKEVLSSEPYFAHYIENIWELYILVTTANSPDVMMPAYDWNSFYIVFFVIFVLLCNYIFMSIFLAVIYKNYRKHLKNEVQTSVFLKRRKLAKAWDILKVTVDSKFVLTWERWRAVMKFVIPKHSDMQVHLLWKVLDNDDNGSVAKWEFLRIVDLLSVKLSTINQSMPFFQKYMATCYNSTLSEFICKYVKHRYFRFFFDFVIMINAFLIIVKVDEAEWYFLGIFMFEILIKMYVYGFYKYFKSAWNVFDFVIITVAFVISAIEEVVQQTSKDFTEPTLDFLLVLRVLRILRVIGGIERYQVIISTISNIGPSILTFGGVLFVIFYVFAVIGMGIFRRRITFYGYLPDNAYTDPTQLYCGTGIANFTKSEFYNHHYCSNNFNDITKAFVVLFELMVVNQWHVIADGFVLVTHKAARIYFLSFHIVMVVIIVNIFIAFILEVFMVEYSLSKSKYEGAIEKKIDELGLGVDLTEENQDKKSKPVKLDKLGLVSNAEGENSTASDKRPKDPGIRFRIGKKSRNVQLSLQAMFEGELDEENIGPEGLEDNDDLDVDENEPIAYTLNNAV
ncbi:two pore calcium channel protein 2-like isoform X1 [Asterias rubens]|uniref:two pore calcium channel protein 2-like isoform X1 n=2 Tax=Asterias rubens TaxID=7604 RepID=UPI00145578F1|nr:two pore calcium channel protein 2-like isoform X1 [Asterias rubens]